MPSDFTPDPARTRLLAERWSTWVLPHWLERQADPAGAAFDPMGATGGVVNRTHLDRVPLGVLDAPVTGWVDPRGLVTPGDGRWSLDWWVGADDRWHLPSREVAVRQRTVDGAPVVETTMRVPGGDVVHRAWAFQDADLGEVVAVEVENAGRVPVALALAIRPYGPDGAGRVDRIEIDRTHVAIDGCVAMWLPREGARVAASRFADGDVAAEVLSGGASPGPAAEVTCGSGFATAALVVPLAHTATVQVLLPLRRDVDGAAPPTVVPPADATARGWRTHVARSVRVELPDPEWTEVLASASAQVLIASADLTLTGDVPVVDAAAVTGALDRLGLHSESAAVVATLPLGQGTGGRLGGTDPGDEATSAALAAAGRHWRLSGNAELVAELAGQLAAGAHHRGAGSLRDRLRRAPSRAARPVDLGRRVRALVDVAHALDGANQADAAGEVRRLVADARADLDAAVVAAVGPRLDGSAVELLELAASLGVVSADAASTDAVVAWVREHLDHEGAVARLVGATGLSPVDTAVLARVELRRGERTALDRLDWLVRTAGPTRVLPELVHPRLLTGCGGAGWSPVVAAALVETILDLLVVEDDEAATLVLCPVWPGDWLGSGVEVHDLPTVFGRLSFAVRWHGERPALLWELAPHETDAAVTLTIPGLDPLWRTTELRGDALLAAPATVLDPDPADEPALPAPGPSVTPVDLRGPSEGDSFA